MSKNITDMIAFRKSGHSLAESMAIRKDGERLPGPEMDRDKEVINSVITSVGGADISIMASSETNPNQYSYMVNFEMGEEHWGAHITFYDDEDKVRLINLTRRIGPLFGGTRVSLMDAIGWTGGWIYAPWVDFSSSDLRETMEKIRAFAAE